ncbi:MAG: hypothetical protein AMS21_13530 [Gemmatimonas sp. SG8_38_2]|nr:MAG: hypothetical protein AMS21_13530 [Gemmatimonas sp. SG8_38_2]
MMSEPTTVDKTAVDELTGKIVLLIEENRPWHETELMHRQMSAKVKHYVRYIRGKKFAEEHGQRPQDTIVRLVTAEQPGDDSIEFLRRVGYELSKHGIEFESQVGSHGIPMALTAEAPTVSPEITEVPPTPVPPTVVRESPADIPPVEEPAAKEEPVPFDEAPLDEELAPTLEAEPEPLDYEPPEIERSEEEAAEPEYMEPDTVELEVAEFDLDADKTLEMEPAELDFDSDQTLEMEPSGGFDDAVSPIDSDKLGPEIVEASARLGGDAGPVDEPSELEMLIDAEADWVDDTFAELDRPLEPGETVGSPQGKKATRPTFFPEEEFGRALPDVDEVEAILMTASSEPAIIETSSGKKILLDVEGAHGAAAEAAAKATGPNLIRAIGAAAGAAVAGAIIWAGLSIGAGHGASPLALVIGLMVGMSVRIQGDGQTTQFRVVGVVGTLIGSLLGATLAGAALSAWQDDLGFSGILANLSSVSALGAGLARQYSLLDIVSLALALYIAYRISASGPSRKSSKA